MDSSPPTELTAGDVTLAYLETRPGDPARGLVPVHRFRILHHGVEVGHLSFKIGDTEHIRLVAGHVGYGIFPPFRGQGLAAQACRALAPFARQHFGELILTADPDNGASIRVFEKLRATFIDETAVPESDPAYAAGSRRKVRYLWRL